MRLHKLSRMWTIAGTLDVRPATEHTDLLADPVAAALARLDPADAARCGIAEIDPELADTAAFCERYGSPLSASANCVVVAGKRSGEQRFAACLVLATTRADVNGAVRRWLDVRKASFVPVGDVVELTCMEYGGITPIGLPQNWPVLIDTRVAQADQLVIGSGVRRSKLLVPGNVLVTLPGVEVVNDLAQPAP